VAVATEPTNATAITENAAKHLDSEKQEILQFYANVKHSVFGLKFSKLKSNEASSSFSKKYSARLKNLEPEVKNFSNNEYLVAVVGRFSSGKSSMINALIGYDILPYDNDETTGVITKVKYGSQQIVIKYKDGNQIPIPFSSNELRQYLCKDKPKYSKDITEVLVSVPAQELKNGITIVDTPGLGSSFDINNQRSMEALSRCSAIIMTFKEVAGKANDETIKEIFQWNAENFYPVIFVITNKDGLISDLPSLKEEKNIIKSVEKAVERAKSELQRTDIKSPVMCLVSSFYEINYRLYMGGKISAKELIQKRGLLIQNIEDIADIEKRHEESGFIQLATQLKKNILDSNIRKAQIVTLLRSINRIIGEIQFDLKDYLDCLANYSTIEELKKALNDKIEIIQQIDKEGNSAVSALEIFIKELSQSYKKDKLDDLNTVIFCQLSDFIDKNSFDELSSNKFKRLIQEFEKIAQAETKKYFKNYVTALDKNTDRMLEQLKDIISRATQRSLLGIPSVTDVIDQYQFSKGNLRVNSTYFGRALFISITTLPMTTAGGFVFGNMIFPGLGGFVGAAIFGVIGLISNTLSNIDKYSEKRRTKVKDSISSFLARQKHVNTQAVTKISEQYIDYCGRIKEQMSDILMGEKDKRDSMLTCFESKKKNVDENKKALISDLKVMQPLGNRSSTLIAKHDSYASTWTQKAEDQ
jgi:predicted GTPase